MTGERRRRVLARLVGGAAPELEVERLCRVGAELAGVSGAGIMLMSGDVAWMSLGATDERSALIEELQYTLGEGPGADAHRLGRPVLEPDLAHPRTRRWLAFDGAAVDAGVRAVFAFPLQVGAARLGALNLYREGPGPLGDDQHADALVLADIAAHAVLVSQAGAPPGMLAGEMEAGSDLHMVVHQASGMVAAQLDVSVGEALVRLRAHAFGHDRPLTDVAHDVVARRLRFEAGDEDKGPATT